MQIRTKVSCSFDSRLLFGMQSDFESVVNPVEMLSLLVLLFGTLIVGVFQCTARKSERSTSHATVRKSKGSKKEVHINLKVEVSQKPEKKKLKRGQETANEQDFWKGLSEKEAEEKVEEYKANDNKKRAIEQPKPSNVAVKPVYLVSKNKNVFQRQQVDDSLKTASTNLSSWKQSSKPSAKAQQRSDMAQMLPLKPYIESPITAQTTKKPETKTTEEPSFKTPTNKEINLGKKPLDDVYQELRGKNPEYKHK
ncbi:hypothetical protein M3Y95_00393000 [Aphelenchoides besseyi]|nr:hypothetical protein M3Y95_00393000 [Aphelenchoides besseyi]